MLSNIENVLDRGERNCEDYYYCCCDDYYHWTVDNCDGDYGRGLMNIVDR